MNARHLIINSNKWFSAVTDYSLQLARFLNDNGGVVVAAHSASPLVKKAENHQLKTKVLPFVPTGFFAFIRCWLGLTRLLKTDVNYQCIWTFEGREHTLCAIHRRLHPALWKDRKLVRVRGQAQPIRGRFFNKLLYLNWTDKIVFVAAAVARLVPFYLSNKQATVQLYCAPQAEAKASCLSSVFFLENVPPIDFSKPVFLVVGRYDPVKGHAGLIDAFSKAAFNDDVVQLVLIGETQNVKMEDLYRHAQKTLGNGFLSGSRAFARNDAGTKRIYLFDERVHPIRDWIASAHFGVIPSLGSEVICRVAVEFLQAGTPVIASYVGALNEVLSGSPSRVFAPQSLQQSVEALEWAASKAKDVAAHNDMRKMAQQKGEEFDLAHFRKLLEFVT